MGTFTLYSDTTDGRIYSFNATYLTARSGGTLTAETAIGASGITVGQLGFSGYYVYESFLSFDTSSVTGTPTSVTLSLYLDGDNSGLDFTVNARAYDWGASLTTADWIAGASLSGNALRATLASSGIGSTGAYKDFTSESTFKDNLTSPVRLVLSSSRTEAGSTPGPDGISDPALDERLFFSSADATNKPKLTIVTTDPASSLGRRRRPSGLYAR